MAQPRRIAGRRKRFLTPDEERIFRQAWHAGEPQHVCARLAGIPYGLIRHRLADQLADLPRRGRGGRGGRRPTHDDPTEDEIYGRLTEQIQAKWTDDDRESKWRAWPD